MTTAIELTDDETAVILDMIGEECRTIELGIMARDKAFGEKVIKYLLQIAKKIESRCEISRSRYDLGLHADVY